MTTYVTKIEGKWREIHELEVNEYLAKKAQIFGVETHAFDNPEWSFFSGWAITEDSDGMPVLNPEFKDHELHIIKQWLTDDLANKRWEIETGGMNFNGIRIATDDRSQTKLIGILLAATMDPTYTVNFKTNSGEFVTLDASVIMQLVNGVRTFVQACFNRENELKSAIAAATTVEELREIKIQMQEKWPE